MDMRREIQTGKIKHLKEGISLSTSPGYANMDEQNKSILKGINVLRYSSGNDIRRLRKI